MDLLIVPFSRRSKLLTVSPRSLVKLAMSASAGRLAGLYATKQGFAPVIVSVHPVPTLAAGY